MTTIAQARKAVESVGFAYDEEETDGSEMPTYVVNHPVLALQLVLVFASDDIGIGTNPSEEVHYGSREYKRLMKSPYGMNLEIADVDVVDNQFITDIAVLMRDKFLALA